MAIDTHSIRGADLLVAQLSLLPKKQAQAVNAALGRIALLAQRESVRNAPRSPTNAQVSATLKRKKRTARRTYPGGLEKSIEQEVRGDTAHIFVASNSFASKYAKRIHDEKGKSWHKRGAGTFAKGQRADDKFIERAIKDNQEKFYKILQDEVRKALAK